MARHVEFTTATDIPVFFCDPHSPWQRGSNENTNGLLRQYFPRAQTSQFTPPTNSPPSPREPAAYGVRERAQRQATKDPELGHSGGPSRYASRDHKMTDCCDDR